MYVPVNVGGMGQGTEHYSNAIVRGQCSTSESVQEPIPLDSWVSGCPRVHDWALAHSKCSCAQAHYMLACALHAGKRTTRWHAQAYPEGGLAYFNCGPHSGMSMPHKHLQIIPLPLGPSETGQCLPTGTILRQVVADAAVGAPQEVRRFPFRAYACRLDEMCDHT
jgi:Ap4A phosphorylase N-terminal domain